MLLINASNLASHGGKVLLHYLTEKLDESKVPHQVLIGKKSDNDPEAYKEVSINNLNRQPTIQQWMTTYKPSKVLHFGNFPPPKKMSVPNYTFFQNALLLGKPYVDCFPFIGKMKLLLRKQIVAHTHKNSDKIFVQSNYVKEGFVRVFGRDEKDVLVLPFADLAAIGARKTQTENKEGFIYVSSGLPHKNHNRLLDAWDQLFEQGIKPKLTLTVSNEHPILFQRIEELTRKGLNIHNLGIVPHQEVIRQTNLSQACIYPSLVETIGLGLVEAQLLGLDVLAPKLPFVADILAPSLSFDPFSVNSIAAAIQQYLKNDKQPTLLVFEDKIKELIKVLA